MHRSIQYLGQLQYIFRRHHRAFCVDCRYTGCQDGGDEAGQSEVGDDTKARFEAYCMEMASTAAWGSQLELGALAQVTCDRYKHSSSQCDYSGSGLSANACACSLMRRKALN